MDRYGVVGNPVAHSLSPTIHAAFAAQVGETISYEKLPAPVDGFVATVERFFADGGRGLNVTLPFKQAAASWVDELCGDAVCARAVNTIEAREEKFVGHNTDGIGFVRDLTKNAGVEVTGRRVLLLGAGGAARGIVRPLVSLAPAHLTIANRTPEKAAALVKELGACEIELSACALRELQGRFDVVINATSAGLQGTGELMERSIVRGAFCYDLVYASANDPTAFCEWASAVARGVRDGLGMLVEQAAEAYFIWRGKRPSTNEVLSKLTARSL